MKASPLRHPARAAGASLLRLQSDERLAELAIDGHEAAFDAIVVRYRAAIQRYCAGIVGPSRAEDATQQTLINAHDALKRTDEVRHLRSWLYRIAHNVSLNLLRAVRDDVPLEGLTARDAIGRLDAEPVEAFERSEHFRATVAALQELPERQRAALVLRELEGRSHEEIADALGVTKGSARQHLMRARVAMRTAVTAITPYPLIVRLSEMMSGPSSAGWTETVAGAGAGATIAKLTAGVVATGALVGGAVGTQQVIDRGAGTSRAAEVAKPAARATHGGAAAGAPVATTISDPQDPAASGGATGSRTTAATKRARRRAAAQRRRSAARRTHAGTSHRSAPAAAGTSGGGAAGERAGGDDAHGGGNGKSGDHGSSGSGPEQSGEKGTGKGKSRADDTAEQGGKDQTASSKKAEDDTSTGAQDSTGGGDDATAGSGDDAAAAPAETTTQPSEDGTATSTTTTTTPESSGKSRKNGNGGGAE